MGSKSLTEYGAPSVDHLHALIVQPAIDVDGYEIHPMWINMIMEIAFAGDPDNDPYKHIDKFTSLCSTVKANGWTNDKRKLYLFRFLLKGKSKDWIKLHPEGHFNSWKGIFEAFLGKYLSQKKTYECRLHILNFKQSNTEDLIQAYSRFSKLMHDCPHHNLPDWLFLNHFYGGLNHSFKNKLDMMCDGAFLGKKLEEA